MNDNYEVVKSIDALNATFTRIADSLERIEKAVVKQREPHPTELRSTLDTFIHEKLMKGVQHEQ